MSEDRPEYNTETADALEMLGAGYHSGAPKTLTSTWSGFTPAPDAIISHCGYVTALVWGKVWRYCQGRDGICRATLERLADELGMSERTIIRHLETLTKFNYLCDKTPDLRNKPHVYADTGKIRIGISVEAAMTESQPAMTESQRQGDRESVEDSIKKVYKKEISNQQPPAIELMFTDVLGRFYGENERKRWLILAEAVGLPRAQELIDWANKKEIHLVNRPSLLNSLETAAKKWREPAKAGNRGRASAVDEIRAALADEGIEV